jgi:hypothetical protein
MKILGPESSLRRHEQDVLFTGAACKAHPKQEVKDIGEEFLTQQQALKEQRAGLEGAEDGLVIAEALVTRTDATRDGTLVSMGAFADALGKGDRGRLFRMAPSDIAKLGYVKETSEIVALLAKVAAYEAGHPIREAYETRLTEENAAFQEAETGKDEAEKQLVAARFAVSSTKLGNDEFRQRGYGRLVTLLGKSDAETFFRKWTTSKKKPAPSDGA